MRPLVIGLGNLDRGDDAVGLLVARGLDLPDVDVCEASGEPTELVSLWDGRQDVWVVDAACSGAPPGTVHHLGTPLPAFVGSGSTHGLGLSDAVELARVLELLPPRLSVVAIEGRDFALGAPLTPEVRAGAEEALAWLKDRLKPEE